MPFWPPRKYSRNGIAWRCTGSSSNGFETYAPRLRDRQRSGFLVAPFTFVARKKRGQKS